MQFKIRFFAMFAVLGLVACNDSNHNQTWGNNSYAKEALSLANNMSLRDKIAQKIILDFRLTCGSNQVPTLPNGRCTTTEINDTIETLIRDDKIGGVIMFAQNVTGNQQIYELNQSIQKAAYNNPTQPFITIDQEGGIVARLSRTESTTFSGAMALGAAYQNDGDLKRIEEVGRIIGQEVFNTGFNVNFAPVVDVNNNFLNPVINVRAFGEDPQEVFKMAQAYFQGMSTQKVITSLKHFPGHGDTNTDSHSGLPVVNKSKEALMNMEIYPYQQLINNGFNDMIMTAHIQFPQLDDSLIYAPLGDDAMIVPATLSRKIQTDLLRNELGFKGVTITDALDMDAIAKYFDETQRTIKAFAAGVDIALMPIRIQEYADIAKFRQLLDNVENAVHAGELQLADIDASVARIIELKLRRGITRPIIENELSNMNAALAKVNAPESRAFERDIADRVVTLVQNKEALLPLQYNNERILILAPFDPRAPTGSKLNEVSVAIKNGLHKTQGQPTIIGQTVPALSNITAKTYVTPKNKADINAFETLIDQHDIIIIASNSTKATLAEDIDLINSSPTEMTLSLEQFLYRLFSYSSLKDKKIIHLSLRAPYDIFNYYKMSHASLVTYDASVQGTTPDNAFNPSIDAAARIIMGVIPATAKLPVTIYHLENKNNVLFPKGFGCQFETTRYICQ